MYTFRCCFVYRFIQFCRTVALSDNMVVNYIANTMTFAYRSIMGKNVRHIMSRYNTTYHELLCTPMSAIKHKCKEMWNINVNAKIICELVALCSPGTADAGRIQDPLLKKSRQITTELNAKKFGHTLADTFCKNSSLRACVALSEILIFISFVHAILKIFISIFVMIKYGVT